MLNGIYHALAFLVSVVKPLLSFFIPLFAFTTMLGLLLVPVNIATNGLARSAWNELEFFGRKIGKRSVVLSIFFLLIALFGTLADGMLFYYLISQFSEKGTEAKVFVILLSMVIPLIMALMVDGMLVQVGGMYLKAFYYFIFHMHEEWKAYLLEIERWKMRGSSIEPVSKINRILEEFGKNLPDDIKILGRLFAVSSGIGLTLTLSAFLIGVMYSKENLASVLIGGNNFLLVFAVSFLILMALLLFGIIIYGLFRRSQGDNQERSRWIDNLVDKFMNWLGDIFSNVRGILLLVGVIAILIVLALVINWIVQWINIHLIPYTPANFPSIENLVGAMMGVGLAFLAVSFVILLLILFKTQSFFDSFNEKLFAILTSVFFVALIVGALLVNSVRGSFMRYVELDQEVRNLERKIENKKGDLGDEYQYLLEFSIDSLKNLIDDEEIGDFAKIAVNVKLTISEYEAKIKMKEKEKEKLFNRSLMPLNIGLALITSSLAYVSGLAFYISIHVLGGGLSFIILVLLYLLRIPSFISSLNLIILSFAPWLLGSLSLAVVNTLTALVRSVLKQKDRLGKYLWLFRRDKYKEGLIDGAYYELQELERRRMK